MSQRATPVPPVLGRKIQAGRSRPMPPSSPPGAPLLLQMQRICSKPAERNRWMRAPVAAQPGRSRSCSEIFQSFPTKHLTLLHFPLKTAADNSEKTAEQLRYFCNEQWAASAIFFATGRRLPEPRPRVVVLYLFYRAPMSSPYQQQRDSNRTFTPRAQRSPLVGSAPKAAIYCRR